MLTCNLVFGQKAPNLDVFLTETILKGMNEDTRGNLKKDFAFFYAIAFVFDKDGKIDTLFYSEKLNSDIKKLYGLNSSLLKRIKLHSFQYKEYASQTILFPFYHYNAADNVVDYKSGLLNNIENLIPEAVDGKSIIIRKPIINAHIPRISN